MFSFLLMPKTNEQNQVTRNVNTGSNKSRELAEQLKDANLKKSKRKAM